MAKIKLDNTPKLKLFQMDKLVPDLAIAMVAKRGSGMSWVIRDVLQVNQNIPIKRQLFANQIQKPKYFKSKINEPFYTNRCKF